MPHPDFRYVENPLTAEATERLAELLAIGLARLYRKFGAVDSFPDVRLHTDAPSGDERNEGRP